MSDLGWWHLAACQGQPLSRFYPPNSAGMAATIETFCKRCPVKDECLSEALKTEEPSARHGIWGGMSAIEREEKFDGKKQTRPRKLDDVCPAGHHLTPDNLISNGRGRKCKACHDELQGKHYWYRTHCKRGHSMEGDGSVMRGQVRNCVQCERDRSQRARDKRKGSAA
jgi:hypothetical protein